jgi:adenylylsulfate reductase subunit B
MYICPNDLMILDPEAMKAYNQEPDACWECYSCVKICPQGAITARPYADFAPMGGTCIPMRSGADIMWTVKFRSGNVKRFKFPIRTTPEGSIKPYEGLPEGDSLDSELLFTEKALATPKEALGKKFDVQEADKTFMTKERGV